MKVENIKNCHSASLSFGALKVAKIRSIQSNSEDVFIYALQKDKDAHFCKSLMCDLLNSDNSRMQVAVPSIKAFIKGAFASIANSDSSAIAVKDGLPFGLFSAKVHPSGKNVHLSYIATWKTPDFKKVKKGGSMIMTYFFNKFKSKDKINLIPAFNSDCFYYRFGFDYEDEYEMTNMFISSEKIKHQLKHLSEKFDYKDLKDEKTVDLSEITKL